jgi:hypothetical protein
VVANSETTLRYPCDQFRSPDKVLFGLVFTGSERIESATYAVKERLLTELCTVSAVDHGASGCAPPGFAEAHLTVKKLCYVVCAAAPVET